ncbi:HesA/MoeB/ThiF family protein [Paludibacterium paludis]|uniref:Molybdopterin-synthase adenylyltransferase n=1 Tax=Paludibacterium paludis TaxID=1225769 RepID=A0A918P0D6_9NEIS|nr:HesA/MoeB/ThiF family protein [Paludibacterium paludis]GGY09809.1 molybdopterin-synthase adenylyltransferase MoeB [Paludibacterium paludis]
MSLSDRELLRYGRHILLDDIDIGGQERLRNARALVVGAGGLGSPVLMYLASAGVGELSVADDDKVELSNLQRQIVHDEGSLGMGKAESAACRMRAINPDCRIHVIGERLAGERLRGLVAAHDLVVDCTDNFPARHAINAACVIAGVPLVFGAAVRFEGQMAVFDPRDAESPCYHCVFPDEGESQDEPCALLGVLSPLVGVIGGLQAVEAVKCLAGIPPATGVLTLFDAKKGRIRQTRIRRDPECPVCRERQPFRLASIS